MWRRGAAANTWASRFRSRITRLERVANQHEKGDVRDTCENHTAGEVFPARRRTAELKRIGVSKLSGQSEPLELGQES